VYYTLRFGDIAGGHAGGDGADTAPGQPDPAGGRGEDRYLFIMVNFDPRSVASPDARSEGAERASTLRMRFAPWYYVIAAESGEAVGVKRGQLVRARGVREGTISP